MAPAADGVTGLAPGSWSRACERGGTGGPGLTRESSLTHAFTHTHSDTHRHTCIHSHCTHTHPQVHGTRGGSQFRTNPRPCPLISGPFFYSVNEFQFAHRLEMRHLSLSPTPSSSTCTRSLFSPPPLLFPLPPPSFPSLSLPLIPFSLPFLSLYCFLLSFPPSPSFLLYFSFSISLTSFHLSLPPPAFSLSPLPFTASYHTLSTAQAGVTLPPVPISPSVLSNQGFCSLSPPLPDTCALSGSC